MVNKKDEFDGELPKIPNQKYEKFFAKFQEINTLDITQWRQAHLLGYFCQKYKETYGVDYAWKFNSPSPTKCFEVWQLNTLCSKLSANPKILKEYIDWIYQVEVPQTKAKFRSISFLTQEERVNNYKLNVLLAGQRNSNIDRSTPFPPTYRDILQQVANISINTYGDLAFISQVEPMAENLAVALNKIEEMGFDREVLKRIV